MHLTDLQHTVLGKMSLTPMRGEDIMHKCNYAGTNNGFAAILLRMRDKGLIDMDSLDPVTWKTTPKGLCAFLDDPRTQKTAFGRD